MELYTVAKLIIESHAFSEEFTRQIIGKLRRFTAPEELETTDLVISREIALYNCDKHDCDNIPENLWQLAAAIAKKREITITCYTEDTSVSRTRIRPVSLEQSGKYFILTARDTGRNDEPQHFRVDYITNIVEHRKRFDI